MSEVAAPSGGEVVGTPSGSGQSSGKTALGLDDLVNGALQNMQSEMGGVEAEPPAPDPNALATGEEPPPDDLEDPEAEAQTKGSKDDPLSINDLKKDRFIKIKIDGEEAVVSERELANGYIRESSFLNKVRQADKVADEARAIALRANEGRKRDLNLLTTLVEDGNALYQFMMGNEVTEQAFKQAAIRFANEMKAWKVDPSKRVQFEAQRERARLDKERSDWERKRTSEDKDREAREVSSRVQMELKPAWEAGLRESGFPNPQDPEFQAEVKARVHVVTQRTGKRVSPAEFKDCVIRAARFLGAAPAQAKPAPAAKPTPKPAQRPNGNGARANPHRVGTVEHIMHGLKPTRI